MRNLSIFNKIILILNIILVVALIIGYLLPYFAPKKVPILSVLTLGLPFLLIINILFLFYWGIQFKRQFWLSFIFLLIGFPFFKLLYKVSDKIIEPSNNDITLLSYNVHLFNKFDWMPDKEVTTDIRSFVRELKPDIVCLQEFSPLKKPLLPEYKYKHVVTKGKNIESGLAILSKYPIVNRGSLDFENTYNNAIYADIKVKGQVIRVYTIHLESIGIASEIKDEIEIIDETKSKKIFKKIKKAFVDQQEQAESILKHRESIDIPTIVCGDMNNSAFSYAYKTIRGGLNDAFVEAGKGFGKSYNFKLFPFRIDYILTDKSLYIKEFVTHSDLKKSDHYPISTRFEIKKED
jgi:endonuclease/exonuclease/phosphatase family metal-dependent hydrolase